MYLIMKTRDTSRLATENTLTIALKENAIAAPDSVVNVNVKQ